MSSEAELAARKESFLKFAESFPFFNLMGIEVLDVQPKFSKTRIAWRDELCQPAGILHGGVIATLVDTGIAHALMLTDDLGEFAKSGGGLVSVDLRIRYFRPVANSAIICESTIPRLGRQIIHGESIVKNEDGKEVARGESIYMAVRGKPKS